MSNLNIGDLAPDFSVEDQNGKTHQLSDYKGKKLVLFFYPKADTPGCTKEACNLRDNWKNFQDKNYALLGVSKDTKEDQQKFIDKYDLPFPLLADTEKEVIEPYGVWGLQKFKGKEFEGINRTTFIIDEEGKIEDIIKSVKTEEHAGQIL